MSPLNIAFVSAHVSPLATDGDPEVAGQAGPVAGLARALGALGHQVTVFTRRDSPQARDRVRLGRGVIVEHVPAGPAQPADRDRLVPHMAAFGRHLSARWLRQPPDVVHAHYWVSGLAALAAARDHRRATYPVVQTFHTLGVVERRNLGGDDPSPESRIRTEVDIARDAALVLAGSADEQTELARLGIPATGVRVIPGGVDTTLFRPDGPAARRGGEDLTRLIATGPLVPQQGLETIIQALPGLPDLELLVAGGPVSGRMRSDPEYRRLFRIADELGVAGRVSFRGRVTRRDWPTLLRSADLMVSVPWYELPGSAVLEALACGVPVVATAVGGQPDLVADGVTGALVPARDSAALARAVTALVTAPDRPKLGAVAAERAREYAWGRVAAQTLAAYEQVITGR